MTLQLALLPFRGTDAHVMGVLADKLAEKGFTCNLLPETAVPADALDRLRGQYRAERLLGATKRALTGRVLGVVDVDLYAEGLNFVFGMAESPGRAAVISLTRLRLGADEVAFEERMLKEAVHELGHTLGLGHCKRPKCVMFFSNSLADTDRKGADFCPDCALSAGSRLPGAG